MTDTAIPPEYLPPSPPVSSSPPASPSPKPKMPSVLKLFQTVLPVFILVAGLLAAYNLTQQSQDVRQKASSYNYQGRFQESTVFTFASLNTHLYGYTQQDYRSPVQTQTLPGFASLAGNALTLTSKGTVLINNPAKNEPFYRISVTLKDAGQTQLVAYLTAIDALWSSTGQTRGASAGIRSPAKTYWWDHTDLKTQSQVSPAEWQFTTQTWNNFGFLARKTQDVKIDLYVTPIGTYPVINGVNYGLFPDMYTGSYTYHGPPPNYLVLGKWDTGPEPVTFTDFKIQVLDNQITSINDVNAYFIKQAVESSVYTQLISDSLTGGNGSTGYGNALWAAFLYRAYDYYFGTDNRQKVQDYFDFFLPHYVNAVNQNTGRYDSEHPLSVNHSFINSTQAYPYVLWAISGYLRPDQLAQIQPPLAKTIDASQAHIYADGTFPAAQGYDGDTFAEETSWLIAFYTGYVALFPTDQPRVEKTLDYLKFLGFHHLSDGTSLAQTYGPAVTFRYLNQDYKQFASRYIWSTGELDNHDFHPSLNYAAGAVGQSAIAKNTLERLGYTGLSEILMRNANLVYENSVKSKLNLQTFHLQNQTPHGRTGNWSVIQDTFATDANGFISDYYGFTKPSLLEDWTSTWTNYSIQEEFGDHTAADEFAKNTYYGLYSGSGKLFCGHVPDTLGLGCGASAANLYNYNFGQALYALLHSQRSTYASTDIPSRGSITTPSPPTINPSCVITTRTLLTDKTTNKLMETSTVGSRLYYRSDQPGWWQDDTSVSWFYNSSPHAPCTGKPAGQCAFTTNVKYYDKFGKLSQSMSIGPSYYNWTDGTGWWAIDHDLYSVARYKESIHTPCFGKSAGQCAFTTRGLVYTSDTAYEEAITIGSAYFEYNSASGWTSLPDHDLTAIARYKESANAPCYGKAPGTCIFTSLTKYIDKNGVKSESVAIGDRYYNWTQGTGWWATDTFAATGRFAEENGPCLTTDIPAHLSDDQDHDQDVDYRDFLIRLKQLFSSATIFDFNQLIRHFSRRP